MKLLLQEPELETELNHYLNQPIDEEAEPLFWWQAHENEFPILSKWLETI